MALPRKTAVYESRKRQTHRLIQFFIWKRILHIVMACVPAILFAYTQINYREAVCQQ